MFHFLDHLEDVAEFVESNRGHAQLVDKSGYIYNKQQTNQTSGMTYWKCREHRKLACKARAQTRGYYILKYLNPHSHNPSEEVLQRKRNISYV